MLFGCTLDDVDADDDVVASSTAVAAFLYLGYKLSSSGELVPSSE